MLAGQRLEIARAKPRDEVRTEDANEGHTVFVRNVPFDTTAEDLAAFMAQFGRVVYALPVKDKTTNV